MEAGGHEPPWGGSSSRWERGRRRVCRVERRAPSSGLLGEQRAQPGNLGLGPHQCWLPGPGERSPFRSQPLICMLYT